MKRLPGKLERAFVQELETRGLAGAEQVSWRTWARYFVDFSLKYGHAPRDATTIPLFLQKLAQKGQGEAKQRDAEEAVKVLIEVLGRFPEPSPVRRGEERIVPAERSEAPAEVAGRDEGRPAGDGGGGGDVAGGSWIKQYEKLRGVLAVGQYALTTRRSYTHWIHQFQGFLRSASPEGIDSEAAGAFLTYIAQEKEVSASTQNQAFNALLFFFRNVLDREFAPEGVKRARRTKYVPQTLTRQEIDSVIAGMPAPYSLLAKLLYGCGLRQAEALDLRVHNFDFDLRVLTIHRGKGQKDRTVPLPEVLIAELRAHLEEVRGVYDGDMEKGFSGAFMPRRGSAKAWDPRAVQWQWQFFFPATRLTRVGDGGETRRFHLHSNRFATLLRKSVLELGTHKKVSAHTFRHSFASHLLMANYDIKTIQEMLGHSDIRTTMIYLQTVPSRTKKGRRSPMDLPPSDQPPQDDE